VLLGLMVSIARSRRSPAHRLLVIAVLAAPFSASLVGLRITRVLAMVVPATLAATLGIDQLQRWLARIVPERAIAIAVAVALTTATTVMTRDALVNGPLWFEDYGMHGMQWGAKELFGDLKRRLATAPPDALIAISHLWANNTNALGKFFLDADELGHIDWVVVDDILRERHPAVRPTTLFVLTPDEYRQASADPKLAIEQPSTVIPNPAGKPGFHLVRMAYTPIADSLFAADLAERRQLVDGAVTIDGVSVRVRHPRFDMGQLADAFDGNLGSLARTLDGNPTNIEMFFPAPRPVSAVRFHLWTDHYFITVRAIRRSGEVAEWSGSAVSGQPPEPIELRFQETLPDVTGLQLSIQKAGDVHVHLREIEILP